MLMFQVCTCGEPLQLNCGEPLQLNEAPTPQPKGTEVLLKILAAGVCHSDLHLADGYFDLGGGKKMSLQRPRHEAAGHTRPRERRRSGCGRTPTSKTSRSAAAC